MLEQIVKRTRERVIKLKEIKPLSQVRAEADALDPATGFPFEKALGAEVLSFICEIKKASPSKGLIARDFPYLQIAQDYEEAGAAAISVLTEPDFFLGQTRYLAEISQVVNLPLLRKDFIVDSYQIYEAKTCGASAILLICPLLNPEVLSEFLHISHGLGLSALVEVHTEEEIKTALSSGARIIGVNNRDLRTFAVDLNTSIRLRNLVPENLLFVAESGIRTPQDVALLKEHKVDAVLIGETLMRSENKKQALALFRGEVSE